MKDKRFVFKKFLLKEIFVTLLLCGGVSLSSAQVVTTLDEIVVTANRAEESRREITSNVTVIGEDEITASTATTLADLMVEHGLQVYTTGDTSNVYIRGFGSGTVAAEAENNVLTLFNGRRIGNANLGLVGLANVERIEIIRGPAAVQYGPAAMGGVINIITKQGRGTDKPYFSAEAGSGSDALYRQNFSFGGESRGLDFAMGFSNYYRDDVTVSDGRQWYNTKINRNSSMNADLGYTIADNHRAGISFNYGSVDSKLPDGGFREDNVPDSSFGQYAKINRNFALNYAGHTSDKAFDWLAAYSFGSDDRENPVSMYFDAFVMTVENRTFNAHAGYTTGLVSLSAGLDYLRYKGLPYSGYSVSPENISQDTGVYFTGKLRLLDERLIFSAGGRYDSYSFKSETQDERDLSNFGGSVGAAYLPVNWLKLRVNYAEGFKAPSASQMLGWGAGASNPDLAPEKSKTVEFGTDINWNFIDAGLTWFHTNWDNKIVGEMLPNNSYRNYNIKAATIAGLEGSFRTDLGKAFGQNYSLKPFVEFTWLGTRRNEDEGTFFTYEGSLIDTLRNTPKWMAGYGLDYNNPVWKFKARVNASRYGVVFTQDWSVVDWVTVFDGPWFERPAGTVVNLSAEQELVRFGDDGGALSLRGEITNLFDGKNEIYWDYPGPGRSYYIGLRYGF